MNEQTYSHNQTRKPSHTYEAPVGKRGAIVMPQALRQYMNIQPTDKILFQVYDDVIEIKTERPMSLEEAFGSVTPKQPGRDLEDIIQEAKEEHYTDRVSRKHQS